MKKIIVGMILTLSSSLCFSTPHCILKSSTSKKVDVLYKKCMKGQKKPGISCTYDKKFRIKGISLRKSDVIKTYIDKKVYLVKSNIHPKWEEIDDDIYGQNNNCW